MTVEKKSRMLSDLVTALTAAHGDNLLSVTLYGSSAHDEADSAKHDVLIVLRQIDLNGLRQASDPIRAWVRTGQPMPVYFSQDELQRAADVFPIEFLQMENARQVLYGPDPFEFVEISNDNLRHQTEYELRTKCLQLRRLYFSSSSADQLTRLMIDSVSSFAALFRAVLILHGAAPPLHKRDAVHATCRALALDVSPFEQIFELRGKKDRRLSKSEAETLFGHYLAEIQKVIDVVDKIEHH